MLGRVATYVLWRFVVSRTHGLPSGGTSTEVPERLCHLKRLDDNSLLFLVVADLGVSRHREVLAQWVAVETVVGHDAPEVGMSHKEDAEQIIDLALIPVGTVV